MPMRSGDLLVFDLLPVPRQTGQWGADLDPAGTIHNVPVFAFPASRWELDASGCCPALKHRCDKDRRPQEELVDDSRIALTGVLVFQWPDDRFTGLCGFPGKREHFLAHLSVQ